MAVALPERPYPLQWPEDWTRTPPAKRRDARYRVGLVETRELILEELTRMGCQFIRGVPANSTRDRPCVVLSSEVPTRIDGLPYSNYLEPTDPGVAVWWIDAEGETRVIACDAWSKVIGNFRAVALTIKALRDIERTKASQILERTMQSFKVYQLPGKPWFVDELALPDWPSSIEDVKESYKLKAVVLHRQGDAEEPLKRLGQAQSEALRALGV